MTLTSVYGPLGPFVDLGGTDVRDRDEWNLALHPVEPSLHSLNMTLSRAGRQIAEVNFNVFEERKGCG
jgi:hypothetical protein